MNNHQAEALLPCPFCKGRAVYIGMEKSLAQCTDCKASASVEIWNHRAPAAPVEQAPHNQVLWDAITYLERAEATQEQRFKAADALRNLAVVPQAHTVAVPEGWKLVPVKHTDAMAHAFIGAHRHGTFSQKYDAMLAASPSHEPVQVKETALPLTSEGGKEGEPIQRPFNKVLYDAMQGPPVASGAAEQKDSAVADISTPSTRSLHVSIKQQNVNMSDMLAAGAWAVMAENGNVRTWFGSEKTARTWAQSNAVGSELIPLFTADQVRRAMLAMQEAAIAAVPGGSICDPQQIADAIRAISINDILNQEGK